MLWKVGVYLQVNVATYTQRGYNCPIRAHLSLSGGFALRCYWLLANVVKLMVCGGMCVGKNLGKIFGLNYNFFFVYLWCGRQEKTI